MASLSDEGTSSSDDSNKNEIKTKVYIPHVVTESVDGDQLVMEESAYHMYHMAQTGFPCLSFDVIPDSLGESRCEFPMVAYMVTGTQADQQRKNDLIVIKMSNLHGIQAQASTDDDNEGDNTGNMAKLDAVSIHHPGCTNRIRHANIHGKSIACTWSGTGSVFLWDISQQLIAMDEIGPNLKRSQQLPIFTFNGHPIEGFAMDWSKTSIGRLLTGDREKNIYLWNPRKEAWHVESRPLEGHTMSVEDLQWSPNEETVFASCSADKTMRIWDTRGAPSKACMLTVQAHSADVNVISWNNNDPFLLSGGDDGVLKVWDLRQLQSNNPVATFKHHQAPISTVEWHPSDSTVFAAAGEDDQLTIWDLALEKDKDVESDCTNVDVPPQLLFIHQGQINIKELHWHSQLPGVIISTAQNGINIFKTITA